MADQLYYYPTAEVGGGGHRVWGVSGCSLSLQESRFFHHEGLAADWTRVGSRLDRGLAADWARVSSRLACKVVGPALPPKRLMGAGSPSEATRQRMAFSDVHF